MSWSETTLGPHVDLISGPAFKSRNFTDDPSDVPLVKGENIGQGIILWEKSKYWPRADSEGYERFSLQPSDVILAMDRPWVSAGLKYAVINERDHKALLVQRVARMRGENGLSSQYLRYIIASPAFCAYAKNIMGGTNVPHISGDQIRAFPFSLPPKSDQHRISSFLSAYDDLIENNRRRIQLLEQAARLLYKEWFVHLRFPGHEHLTITDGVPEGWEKMKLTEIADIRMGQSPKSIYYNGDGNGLPFHQGVTNFGVRFPSHQTYCTVQNRLAEPGDILFSVRAPVGRINITINRIVIGRGLAAIRSKLDQQNLLFYALKSHFFKEDLIGSGAIFAAITKKDLHGVELIQASDRIPEMFMEHVRPIDLQIENLHQTIDNLTQARDLLLPRLMNGEVAV
ncbi:MAG: restriction endonuclease subunit S [Chloroflexi bacterium]|nr:restriction endonuclease subunit S [Chloroflexota bacterium]